MFGGAGSSRATWPSVFLTHENGLRQDLIAKNDEHIRGLKGHVAARFPLKLDLVVSNLMELRRSFRLGISPVQPQPAIVEGGTELHLIDLIKVARQLFK